MAVLLAVFLALPGDGTPRFQLKLAPPEQLDQPPAISHRIAHARRFHSPGELVENLLGVLGFQAVEDPRQRPPLRISEILWKAKITTIRVSIDSSNGGTAALVSLRL